MFPSSHSIRKRLLAFSLCTLIVFSTTACFPIPNFPSLFGHGSQKSFDTFTNDLFIEGVTSDSITLHYTLRDPAAYGIDDFEPTLGSFCADDIGEDSTELKETYDKLHKFNYNSLTAKQQQLYDILDSYLTVQMQADGLDYYQSIFSTTTGLQNNLPITLAEYQFYTEKDITDYITLLSLVPDYFDECIAFEQKKSEKGLFMADFAVDEVVTQCEDFIATPDDNVLITTFNTRIDAYDDLSESEKESYKQQNEDAVLTYIIPAYQSVIDGLTALKGTGSNDGGLCNYSEGKEYYEYLVASKTGSSRSVDDMTDMIEDSLQDAFYRVYDVYSSDSDAYYAYYEEDMDVGMTDPSEIEEFFKEKLEDSYPQAPACNYEIKYVDPSLEDSLSPAFYMVPPIDDSLNNVIYINNGDKHEAVGDLFATLAHEGYPGHLYQTTYFHDTDPNPLRSILSYNGYVEGWATYVEMDCYNMVTFADYGDSFAKMGQASTQMSLAVSSRIDIGVNYEGWTSDEVASYLDENGLNAEAAQDIYEYVVQEPANYLQYYIGYLEFKELEDKAQRKLGSDYDAVAFHRTILDVGPAPFDIVESYVDDYIAENE